MLIDWVTGERPWVTTSNRPVGVVRLCVRTSDLEPVTRHNQFLKALFNVISALCLDVVDATYGAQPILCEGK